jgi:flagellar motor protein MotB
MFRRQPEPSPKGEEENPFLLSFSDLMASLLAIFILALVVMMIQLHLKQKEIDADRKQIQLTRIELLQTLNEIQQAQDAVVHALEGVGQREKSLVGMLESIQEDLKAQGIEVLVTENGTVLRIPETALSFELSKFTIQDHYKASADLIGAAILRALQLDANRTILDTVFIEGHTDSVRNRQEMGNWGLSTYRAISLWLHWTEAPGNLAELKTLKSSVKEEGGIERPLISTSGYADTRPADLARAQVAHPIDTGNPTDRRIDIRFTLASSEKKDLGDLKGQLEKMRSKTDELVKKLKEVE